MLGMASRYCEGRWNLYEVSTVVGRSRGATGRRRMAGVEESQAAVEEMA